MGLQLSQGIQHIKSLIALYQNYADSSPSTETELKSVLDEMGLVRTEILVQLEDLRKDIRIMQDKVKPGGDGRA